MKEKRKRKKNEKGKEKGIRKKEIDCKKNDSKHNI